MSRRTLKQPKLQVSPETARVIGLGHPWVIADRHTRSWPRTESGQLAELVDEQGRFLGTALLDPQSRLVARVLSRSRVELDAGFLRSRLSDAFAARRWLALGDTDAWRLVNGEGDGLPGLTIDRYADFVVVQYFTRAWEPHLPVVARVLQETEVFNVRGVYVKHRPQQTRTLADGGKKTPYGSLVAGTRAPCPLTVVENGLSFEVDLVNDLNTGLFTDQRCNRQRLRERAGGRRFLNLFAYTGAFSVAAAAGGARRVTSVDVSARYLDQAQRNFRLNGIDPADHEFIVGDCFAELDTLARNRRRFDLVLMDPPSFSTTRRRKFTTGGGTAELVAGVLPLIEPGGLLITSSNLQKMALNDYLKELRKAGVTAGRTLKVIEVSGQSADFPFPVGFPEGHYLKYVVSVVEDQF